jgi:peptide deformylase
VNDVKTRPYLRLYPDTVLRQKALPVADIDRRVRALVKRMVGIMEACGGIGLAAPQVGVLRRVIIADIGEGLITLANPEVLLQEGEACMVEGCLSLPGVTVNVSRKMSLIVRGMDTEAREVEWQVTGLLARVVQHEIDHLNGVLVLDHGPILDQDGPEESPPVVET